MMTTLGQISASSYGKIPLDLLEEFFAEDLRNHQFNIYNAARIAAFIEKYPEHTQSMIEAVIDIAYHAGYSGAA